MYRLTRKLISGLHQDRPASNAEQKQKAANKKNHAKEGLRKTTTELPAYELSLKRSRARNG